MTATERLTNKRNDGVDTLRILSMLLVLTAHILTQGGVLAGMTEPDSWRYRAAWLLRALVICDVNCFALITGYVSVDSRFRPSRVILLWLQVLFYSVGLSVLLRLLGLGVFDPAFAFSPILKSRWWYMTAYFGMVLFIPFICLLFDHMSRKQASMLAFAVILVFSLLPSLYNKDIFRTSFGYSALWLMALFVLGAYVRRHNPFPNCRRRWLIVAAVCALCVWLWKLLAPGWGGDGDQFLHFTSIFVLITALALLFFFSRVQMPAVVKKLTRFFAPVAFGVYLIHVHPGVWNQFMADRFVFLTHWPAPLMVLGVAACALGLFLVCTAADWLRLQLFRLLRVEKLADWLGEQLTRLADKLFR